MSTTAALSAARRFADEAAEQAQHATNDNYPAAAQRRDDARRFLAQTRRALGYVGLAPSGVGIDV
jgi:hypothetical protein